MCSLINYQKPKISIKLYPPSSNDNNKLNQNSSSQSYYIGHNISRMTTLVNWRNNRIPCYTPGEWLRGRIDLRFFSDNDIKLCVYLEGYMDILPKNNEQKKWKLRLNAVQLWPNENAVKMNEIRIGEMDHNSNKYEYDERLMTMSTGRHFIEFQIKLPGDCPPSYQTQRSRYRFCCVTELSYLNESPFCLGKKPDEQKLAVVLPFRVRQNIDFAPFCIPRPPMPVQMFYRNMHLSIFSIKLEKFCFTNGETISIYIAPLDDYRGNVFLKKCFVRAKVYIAQIIKIAEKVEHVERKRLYAGQIANKNGKQKNNSDEIKIAFPLRISTIPSFNHSQLHVEHELQLKFHFKKILWPASYTVNFTIPGIMLTEKKWIAIELSNIFALPLPSAIDHRNELELEIADDLLENANQNLTASVINKDEDSQSY